MELAKPWPVDHLRALLLTPHSDGIISEMVKGEFCKTFERSWTSEELIKTWEELNCPNAVLFTGFIVTESVRGPTVYHMTFSLGDGGDPDHCSIFVGIPKWGVAPLYWMKLLSQCFDQLSPEHREAMNVVFGELVKSYKPIQDGRVKPIGSDL